MPREIYDEGRTVGLSMYEIYVKQLLAEDPTAVPATEKEWLASSLAMGSSMLLKVPNTTSQIADDQYGYIDIPLPSTSRLAAANTIVASFFDGTGHFPSGSNWADYIISYGNLLANDNQGCPEEGDLGPDATSTQLPTETLTDTNSGWLEDYMKLVDGIVIQPGNWHESPRGSYYPAEDFYPNLYNTYPRIRIKHRGPISTSPLVLLTGFTINSILAGTTGQDGSVETDHPEDGDFLGPVEFPWANKIVFCVPNNYIQLLSNTKYTRAIGSGTSFTVKDKAIVDMEATSPEIFYKYYTTNSYYKRYNPTESTPGTIANPRTDYTVTNLINPADGCTSALTVYQRNLIYPPALYGSRVEETGTNYLNPLDVVAPGTIKMFQEQTSHGSPDPTATLNLMVDYESTFPGTWAMARTADGHIQYVHNGSLTSVASQNVVDLSTVGDSAFKGPSTTGTIITYANDKRPAAIQIKTGSETNLFLSISSRSSSSGYAPTGQQVDISTLPSSSFKLNHTSANDEITWAALLGGLQYNSSLDLLGNALKNNKYSMMKPINGSNWSSYSLYDTTTGASHLIFGGATNGSSTDPTLKAFFATAEPNAASIAIPDGSLGTGWGGSWNSRAMWRKHIAEPNNLISSPYWTPLWGGEFYCRVIKPSGYSDPDNKYAHDVYLMMNFGLIMIGRCGDSNSNADMRDIYKDYILHDGDASNIKRPAIAVVDHWKGIYWISRPKGGDYYIELDTTGTDTHGVHVYSNTSGELCFCMAVGNIKTWIEDPSNPPF